MPVRLIITAVILMIPALVGCSAEIEYRHRQPPARTSEDDGNNNIYIPGVRTPGNPTGLGGFGVGI